MVTEQGNLIRLTNALYIADLPLNLISVVYLQTLGITTLFRTKDDKICKNNQVIDTGTPMENGLCKFDSTVKVISNPTANVAIRTKSVPLNILHQRFGHLSVYSIKKLAKSGFVDGLKRNFTDEELQKFVCNAPNLTKRHLIFQIIMLCSHWNLFIRMFYHFQLLPYLVKPIS